MSFLSQDTPLERLRRAYQPKEPALVQDVTKMDWERFEEKLAPPSEVAAFFPHTGALPFLKGVLRAGSGQKRDPLRVGVVFSGGPAPGGHNVVIGLHEALKQWHSQSALFGFLNGPDGVVEGEYKLLDASILDAYRNMGGFDLLGSGRAKVETQQQLETVLAVVTQMRLDGFAVIGGDDSNTNAAVMADYFLKRGCKTRVIGVPKTIDGDLKNSYVEIPFGFDTACKIYSEMIGNIARDALSARKYYHFIKVMGRSASHIALECALMTQPNLAWIGEEIAEEKRGLADLVDELVQLIEVRANLGKHFGVILIPEGIIEWIPEVGTLIKELNQLLIQHPSLTVDQVKKMLSPSSAACFALFTEEIQQQLLLHRDPHGNVQVSLIETHKLFSDLARQRLKKKNIPFDVIHHFLGYEGRCGFPSNFDSDYCFTLGKTAASLIAHGKSGYMACVRQLTRSPRDWEIVALPLVALMQMEMREGVEKPVIKKTLVNMKDKAFIHFKKTREVQRLEDHYRGVGPLQFFGDPALTDMVPLSLLLNPKNGSWKRQIDTIF